MHAGLGKTQILRKQQQHQDEDVEMHDSEKTSSSHWSEANDDDMRPPAPGDDVEIPGDVPSMADALDAIWQGGECVYVREGVHVHTLREAAGVRYRGVVRIEADEGSEVWGCWWVKDAARLTARRLRACVHAFISQVYVAECVCGVFVSQVYVC
jgi:hypothetical protein